MADKNYLIINKKGRWLNYYKGSFSTVLKTYIDEQIGYETGFNMDKTTWNSLDNEINTNHNTASGISANKVRIDCFNTGCKNPKNQIDRVIYNHTIVFPDSAEQIAEVDSYFIINNLGKYFNYTETNTTLSKALNAYINDCSNKYGDAFKFDRDLWNTMTDCFNNSTTVPGIDILRIKTFNLLCKKKSYHIAFVGANYGNVYLSTEGSSEKIENIEEVENDGNSL